MLYTIIKSLHISAVVVSGLLFLYRGLRLVFGQTNKGFALKVLPHIVDTVLLGCGIYMAYLSHQYPLLQGWLTAKVLALLIYVFLGHQALKQSQPLLPRLAYFSTALLVYLYIIGTAHHHSIWSWMRLYI